MAHRRPLVCLLLALSAFRAFSAEAPMRCEDVFNEVKGRVETLAKAQYEQDFGPGVFVQKVSNTEFRIEPPVLVVNSVRDAQKAVGERSEKGGDAFTVMFTGFSEGEVVGFKAMLQRDAKIQRDDKLTSVLLTDPATSKGDYDKVRDAALSARERMTRRYKWADATVVAQDRNASSREERYLLTAVHNNKPDEFMLRVRVRAASMLANRSPKISDLLADSSLVDASAEQAARRMIAELKRNDKGVTDVTLKVMAGDFVIASAK